MGSLLGLAPGGVYPATHVAIRAVRSYRTLSPLPPPTRGSSAVCFLRHFPWARAPQALPGTLSCGARTFLPPDEPGSDCLAVSFAGGMVEAAPPKHKRRIAQDLEGAERPLSPKLFLITNLPQPSRRDLVCAEGTVPGAVRGGSPRDTP